MRIPSNEEVVAAYRAAYPRSRAVRLWTYTGSSGAVKRATCIACRETIATCSAKWPETETYKRAIPEHLASCGAINGAIAAYSIAAALGLASAAVCYAPSAAA